MIGHAITTLVWDIADNRIGNDQQRLAETIRKYWEIKSQANDLAWQAKQIATKLDDDRKADGHKKTAKVAL